MDPRWLIFPSFPSSTSSDTPPPSAWKRGHPPGRSSPPTSLLLKHLRRRDWEAARWRLLTYPWDAAYGDPQYHRPSQHQTPLNDDDDDNDDEVVDDRTDGLLLHVACLLGAPQDVVVLLVRAHPSAVWQRDARGWTALHLHVLHHPRNRHGDQEAVPITQCLLQPPPATWWWWSSSSSRSSSRRPTQHHHHHEGDHHVSTSNLASMHAPLIGSPLHVACRHWYAVPGAPADESSSSSSSSPLHPTNRTTVHLIQCLVQADPQQVLQPNEAGLTPATLLYQAAARQGILQEALTYRSSQRVQTLLCTLHVLVHAGDPIDPGQGDQKERGDQNPPHPPLKSSSPLSGWSWSLHQMIAFQYQQGRTSPNYADWVGWIMRLFPDLIQQADHQGRLPLHQAAMFPPPSAAQEIMTSDATLRYWLARLRAHRPDPHDWDDDPEGPAAVDGSRHRGGDPLMRLLGRYPSAASCPDQQGWLPLHLALHYGRRHWRTGIALLVRAAPDTWSYPCPRTALWPLQLAALPFPATRHEDGLVQEVEEHQMETILELLKYCPHAVMMLVMSTEIARATH